MPSGQVWGKELLLIFPNNSVHSSSGECQSSFITRSPLMCSLRKYLLQTKHIPSQLELHPLWKQAFYLHTVFPTRQLNPTHFPLSASFLSTCFLIGSSFVHSWGLRYNLFFSNSFLEQHLTRRTQRLIEWTSIKLLISAVMDAGRYIFLSEDELLF